MAAVALDRAQPLARQPVDRLRVEFVGVGDLAPDHQAEFVGPVQEARILDLLVDAHGVEAESLDQLDLLP